MVEVVVEYSYEAEQPDELTIKPGDILKNVLMVEGGWWEGELNGKKGMFPDNFVKVVKNQGGEVEKRDDTKKKLVQASKRQSVKDLANKLKDSVHEGPPMLRKKEPGSKKKRAKVVFSYDPENDDELQLGVGDMVEVIKQEEEGWWEGTLNGKQGMFPSNFVEILEESGSEPAEAEKASDTPEEENLIKGKKIHGVGLGNIFGDGPIKLRPTVGGIKPGSKPQEPPKTEKRSEESMMRRQKDASLFPTNPTAPNPDLVMDTLSDYVVVRSDDVYEIITHHTDRHNLNNSSDRLSTDRPSFPTESSTSFRDNDSIDTEENMADYNDIEFSPSLQIEELDVSVEASQEMENSVNVNDTKPTLDENENALDVQKNSIVYAESLKTILDDLDNCLVESYNTEDSDKENQPIIYCRDVLQVDTEQTTDLDNSAVGSESARDNRVVSEGTPIHSDSFAGAIDSVFVTRQRYLNTSKLSADQTPPRPFKIGEENYVIHGLEQGIDESTLSYESPQVSKQVLTPVTELTPVLGSAPDFIECSPEIESVPDSIPSADSASTPVYLPEATRHPQTSYLSALNTTGHLSPFMRSIANRYRLFEPTKPAVKEPTVNIDDPKDTEDSYTSFMMAHSVDTVMASIVEQTLDGNNPDVDEMVRQYVYDVLTEPSTGQIGLSESDIEIDQKDAKPDEDESLMVCLDECSMRFMTDYPKDDEDDGTDEDVDDVDSVDSILSDGGVLLSMTEGSDSSPPLSCCSGSLYPNLDHSTPAKSLEANLDDIGYQKMNKSLPEGMHGYNGAHHAEISPGYPGLRHISFQRDTKLPASGYVRATSSYCRIPFKDDAPSFWFKKDFEESPHRLHNSAKARSPKRTISQITDTIPTLFALAEKVYLDEFKHKIETFKVENLGALPDLHTQCFYSDRSPARKKRRKNQDNCHFARLSPRHALNFNCNALPNTVEQNVQIAKSDDFSSIDTFFAEKYASPEEIAYKVPSEIEMDFFRSASCSTFDTGPKVNWSEKLFSRKSKSFHKASSKYVQSKARRPPSIGDTLSQSKLTEKKDVNNSASVATQSANYQDTSDYDQYLSHLVEDCSEKRKKRRFRPTSKSDLNMSPVKLVGFTRLERDPDEQLKDRHNSYQSNQWSTRDDKTISLTDIVLSQNPSNYVSQSLAKQRSQILKEQKIQEVLRLIALEDNNDVLSYFDHGDETELYDKLEKSDSDPETGSMDISIASVKEAVDEHVVSSNIGSSEFPQVVRMLDTREKLYEAISNAMTVCSESIRDDRTDRGEQETSSCLNDTRESLIRSEGSLNVSADSEALIRDMKNIDLSGTPVYAQTQETDSEMKTFLKDALGSLDNILTESPVSFSLSPGRESLYDENSVSFLKENITRASKETQTEEECDEQNQSIEFEDDPVLTVLGKACTLHEREAGLCDDDADTSVEVLEDSILRITGQKCAILSDKSQKQTCRIPELKVLCCRALQRKPSNYATVTVRDGDVGNFDEVYEVIEESDELKQVVTLARLVCTGPDNVSEELFYGDPTDLPNLLPHPPTGHTYTLSSINDGIETIVPLRIISSTDHNSEDTDMLVSNTEGNTEDPFVIEMVKTSMNNKPVDASTNTEPYGEYLDESYLEEVSLLSSADLDESLNLEGVVASTKERLDSMDDTTWMEEHIRATSARTPVSEYDDVIMTDSPPEFEEKVSSYPSPKI